MKKLKRFFTTLLISAMCFTISGGILAAGTKNSSSTNPYIKFYLDKKANESLKVTSQSESTESLDDPEVEEQIILSALKDYYNDDMKVISILKKFIKDPELEANALSTDKEGKISTMKYIKEVYSNVENKDDQDILKGYLNRYATNSQDEASITFLNELYPQVEPQESQEGDLEKNGQVSDNSLSEPIISLASYSGTYNKSAAANWAYNNYNSYSTSYPKFTDPNYGSDCTNFVSQAMHTGGGMPMQGSWYCYKKNSTYWVPANATQLNYSWSLANPSPWISVKEFDSFWDARTSHYAYSTSYYKSNHATVYNKAYYAGDVIILHKGVSNVITVPTHAMIISRYDTGNKDFLLAAHSTNRQAYPLLSAISAYAMVEFICF